MDISNFKIKNLRASLFTPQITFEGDFISNLQKILTNYLPSCVFSYPQIINNIPIYPGEWLLISSDNTKMLIFHALKIDFLSFNVNAQFSREKMNVFIEECKTIFSKILDVKGMKAHRLAIAPTFKYIGEETLYKGFVNTIFAKNNFENSNIENCDFSQVFRIDEKIGEIVCKLNYLSRFYTISEVVRNANNVNGIQDTRMLDFDINTVEVPQRSFDTSVIKDFFDKSIDFCDKFMSWYLDK